MDSLDATPGTYTSMTIRGSQDTTGVTCSELGKVDQLAAALRNRDLDSGIISCSGRNWKTSSGCGTGCGNAIELITSTNPASCQCGDVSTYNIRPSIGNYNWGGVNGSGCSAETQTMEVVFVAVV
jgi:hypothetical protein